MALKPCKECGKEVSTKAEACPHCGAKPAKQTSVLTWIFGGFFALIVISMVNTCGKISESASAPAKSTEAPKQSALPPSTPIVATENVVPPLEKRWDYSAFKDEMSGQLVGVAWIESNDKLNFSFPYSGNNQPSLNIRKHPRHGTDVSIRVDKGQFLCGYDDCSVNVKFDDKPPVRFSAVKSADRSTTILFITPERKFIKALLSAKTVIIEAGFYQEGSRAMTFNTAGLVWK